MGPVYFPFTYMSKPVADVLAAVFEEMTVLSPSAGATDASSGQSFSGGRLSVVSPFDDDVQLDRTVESYRAWADLHGGADLKQFLMQQLPASFSGESSTFLLLDEIRSRTQRSGRGSTGAETESEQIARHRDVHIRQSRALLLIAEEYDRRNWEIRQDLAAAATMERNLLNELHATDGGVISGPVHSMAWPEGDVPSYMLAERFEAWACFLSQDAAASFRIFVTVSKPIMEKLVQALPSTDPLATISKIAAGSMSDTDTVPEDILSWRKKLAQWLNDQALSAAAAGSAPPPIPPVAQNSVPAISLAVYRTEKNPLQWFRQAAGITTPVKTKSISRATGPATLLVFVSMDHKLLNKLI